MWHLLFLLSIARVVTSRTHQDVPQIDRSSPSFTTYDVLNYTSVSDDEPQILGIPLRILCVGDSITVGWGSDLDGGDGNGYRFSLAEHLAQEDVVFAGTNHQHGSMEGNYHASWSGKTIQYIGDHVTDSLEQRPNVILLHAGTNDMDTRPSISREGNDPEDVADRLGQLIDKIVSYCPGAVILVAIPISSCDEQKPEMPQYRSLIPGVVRQRRQNGEHVMAVDFSSFALDDLRDCLHPTNDGYSIMGDYWYDFLMQVPRDWIEQPVGDNPEREDSEQNTSSRVQAYRKSHLGAAHMSAEVSHGRGGAGNFKADDTQYVDGEVVRTGLEGSHGDGAYSSGRGGAGNISDVGAPTTERRDKDMIPETAVRPSQDDRDYHTGRGGAGNAHPGAATESKPEENDKPVAKTPVGLADKLKAKIFGGHKK
ncbi:hypothetical protein F66182_2637 [Fusarium sp. NRRL 66182]|nr:hypothetical protein F66182_2637 [Fusarium sp. NRRL 66182]